MEQGIDPKYIISLPDNTGSGLKRHSLKPGDSVYYYNCDRLHGDRESMFDELSLVGMKGESRKRRNSDKKVVSKKIMKSVIEDLREMRICREQDSEKDCIEGAQMSSSKNTRSIASIALKSNFNRNTVGNQLEKQKARRYKRIKARILGILGKYQEEKQHISKEVREDEIDDELELGKRKIKSKMVKLDSLNNYSTDYSKNSFDHDRLHVYNYLQARRSSDNPSPKRSTLPTESKLHFSDCQMNEETTSIQNNSWLACSWQHPLQH